MFYRFLLSAASALAVSFPAFAGDPYSNQHGHGGLKDGQYQGSFKDGRYYALYNWNGFYAGLQGGYQWSEISTDFSDDDAVELDGFVGGGHVGANFQHGRFVFGVEGDLEYVDGEESERFGALFDDDLEVDLNAFIKTEWQASIRGRFGFAANRTLYYATAGVAFTEVEAGIEGDLIDSGVVIESDRISDTQSFTGFTVGGGIEGALRDNITARLEYRYTDFGDGDDDLDVELDQHAIRFGFSYKFDTHHHALK